MFAGNGCVHAEQQQQQLAEVTEATGGEAVMKQPMIGKQFSLCPDTGELEASRRSQEKLHRQQQQQQQQQEQQQQEEEGLGLSADHLSANAFGATDLVDAKLLASLSFENLDLKLEDATTTELLDHVVKSEGGTDQFSDAVALAALGGGGDVVGPPVKREPGAGSVNFEEEQPAKVRRVMVNDATIQQLLSAAGQVVTDGTRAVSLAVDPRLLQQTQIIQQQPMQQHAPQQQQQQQHQQQQQQTRFLIAWKAENNELVPVCIPVQGQNLQLATSTGAELMQGNGQTQLVSSPQPQQQQQSHQQHAPQQQPTAATVTQQAHQQPTVIQLPASGIIPALAQGATLQIPAGSAFPGLTQALQIPSSGILHAAGSQGTVLQLPAGAGELGQGTTILQIPAGHLHQQQQQHQHFQQVLVGAGGAGAAQVTTAVPAVVKEDHDMDVVDEEEVVAAAAEVAAAAAAGVSEKGLGDDVTSSGVADAGGTTSAAAAAPAGGGGVEQEEAEMDADEDQDSESWRLRHAVTILEKSQINFLRDARRSFKCYQCGGLIRPPALEVEVDLAPYGIRPVLCTDCGKFHLNKRNVNVRVTTDEGCEQLHRFMSA